MRLKHLIRVNLTQRSQRGGINGQDTVIALPVVLPVELRGLHRLVIEPVPAQVEDAATASSS